MTAPPVWFVTGCSSGLGLAVARAALERGDRVVATARRPGSLAPLCARFRDRAVATALDVTDPGQVDAAVTAAVACFGRIDVLVNNAGYGLLGAVEEVDDAELRRQFATNVFGAWSVTRRVLPEMRSRGGGRVIVISSGAGFAGIAGAGAYCASKFALEGFAESLAGEVAHLGIGVTIVEPGLFRTDFAGRSLVEAATRLGAYGPSAGRTRSAVRATHTRQAGDPDKAARVLVALATEPVAPRRVVLGADAYRDVAAKLESVRHDLDAWREQGTATAFATP